MGLFAEQGIEAEVAQQEISSQALAIGFRWRYDSFSQLYYCYEKDCDYAVIWYEHPEWRGEYFTEKIAPEIAQEEAKKTLESSHPEYFDDSAPRIMDITFAMNKRRFCNSGI